MRKTVIIAAIALLAGTIGAVMAHDADSSGRNAQQTISIDAMKRKIDVLGYEIRRLRADDGVFKAQIVDRESGGVVKANFDLADGELIRAKLGD